MANAIAGTVPPSPHLAGVRGVATRVAGVVRFGAGRSGDCWYPRRKWNLVMCAALSGSGTGTGTEGPVIGDAVSKPRRSPRVSMMGSKLIGCGSAVPKFEITNDDMAKIVDTSDEWISVRTGIRKRRVLTGEESLNGMAVEAGKKALEMAQVDPEEVDVVLLCTSTPDDLFGSGAQVLSAIGCKNAWASDVTAACSGFLVGMVNATCLIKGGGYQNVLVIGADCLSRYVDWTDRGTCILFGDGAGAVLLQATAAEEDGFLGFDIHSDGQGYRHLKAKSSEGGMEDVISSTNGSTNFPPKKPAFSYIQMNGKEVFRFAVRCVPQSIEASLEKAGITSSDIDWLLLHQANLRIIDAVATRLHVPSEKIISNLANYGNTSAASIPLALDEAVRGGKVKGGDIIAASGFGAGLTWGSAIIRWQ